MTAHFRRSRGRHLALGVALASLVLAACGSNIDPNTVAAGGSVAGSGQQGGLGSTVPGAEGPVDGVPGTDPGTGQPGAPGADPGDVAGVSDTNAGPGTGSGDTGGPGNSGGAGTPDAGNTGGSGPSGTNPGGSNSGGPTGGPANPGTSDNAADGGVKEASCAGFKNSTGITDKTINIANISDISGPVPGIFESSQEATRAYAAYFNSTSDICGRKLNVTLLDSRADAGADQQAATKACSDAFATVGSMSAFDSGGAATTSNCGMPDIRSTIVNPQRNACKSCFAAQAINPGYVASSIPKFFASSYSGAAKSAAFLYINAGAAPVNAKAAAGAFDKNGVNVDYVQGIDVSEFNYAPYVQQMKNKGVKLVSYMGPYQNAVKLKQAMRQQGFTPEVFLLDATAYDPRYVKAAGSDGDGTFIFMNNEMFTSSNAEMKLYLAWLQQVKPGATPTFYGLYSWSATRLFVEQSLKLGGKLNRGSLVSALSGVKGWTGNGVHAPMSVGGKSTSGCTRIIKLDGGNWKQISSGQYMCGPLTAGN